MVSVALPTLTLAALLAAPLGAQAPATQAPAKKAPAKPKGKRAVKQEEPPIVTTPSGLKYQDHKVGDGLGLLPGMKCRIHYTGWLSEQGKRGKKFDSSVDRKEPLVIPIGAGRVIKGWDEGVLTMKVGGKRTLYIPAELGYGARGAGGVIPPGADLIFDVELLGIQ